MIKWYRYHKPENLNWTLKKEAKLCVSDEEIQSAANAEGTCGKTPQEPAVAEAPLWDRFRREGGPP
jgi:hypothetical protein